MNNIYDITAKHLIDDIGISTRFINIMASDQSIHKIVSIIDTNFSPTQKLALMLKIEGANFFAGNDKREFRKKIIEKRNYVPVNVINAGIGGITAVQHLIDVAVFNTDYAADNGKG